MLQVGLPSKIDPGHGAGIDESEVSVVNRDASRAEPLAGDIADELVAYASDPFGAIAGATQAILSLYGLEHVGSAILALDGLQQGVHVGRRVSGRHCRLMSGDGKERFMRSYGASQVFKNIGIVTSREVQLQLWELK